MLENGPLAMLALKLLFIPAFLGGGWLGRRTLRRLGIVVLDAAANRRLNLRVAGAFVAAVLLAAALRLAVDLEPFLPPFARIHATHFKWFGIELLFATALGFAFGVFSIETPLRRRKLGLAGLGLFLAMLAGERHYTRPVYEACRDLVVEGVTIQTFPSTCGPASLCNLLRQFGIEVKERDAARVARTRPTGTTGDELALTAPRLAPGFHAHYFKEPLERIERLGLPCVLSFGEVHFVTFTGRRAHLYEYLDPSVGRCMYKKDDLMKEWDGKSLFIYPADFDFEAVPGESHPAIPALREALRGMGRPDAHSSSLAALAGSGGIPDLRPPQESGDRYDPELARVVRDFSRDELGVGTDRLDPYLNLLIYARAGAAKVLKK